MPDNENQFDVCTKVLFNNSQKVLRLYSTLSPIIFWSPLKWIGKSRQLTRPQTIWKSQIIEVEISRKDKVLKSVDWEKPNQRNGS